MTVIEQSRQQGKTLSRKVLSLLRIRAAGRASDGWASRPGLVPNAVIRELLAEGLIEDRAGQFPVYRVTPAGHALLAAERPVPGCDVGL